MEKVFEFLDNLVQSFMSVVFDKLSAFFADFFANGGRGAYICFLLIGLFLTILLLIGLVKLIRKFGLFLILLILTVGIPCVWFFLVK